ncbi:MAG TPA: Minf_1886 family protein [Pirellulales bacterium]|nr:Minf_1886 family protein [Pirellulales bacterium]
MPDLIEKIKQLVRDDSRYKFEAYAFVFESLNYAQKELGMGAVKPTEPTTDEPLSEVTSESEIEGSPERHLTGQQLCEASRRYALEQYGYMAKCVLNSWGIFQTGDLGEIVFNLIRAGQMKKTKDDRREDFDDVFDFDAALEQGFKIDQPK